MNQSVMARSVGKKHTFLLTAEKRNNLFAVSSESPGAL